MWLTVILGLGVGAAALLGLLRGLRPGLVAVAGTLLAAVAVDLWAGALADWVRATFRPELPAGPTFAALAAAFVLAALLLGYGGAALLPRPPDAADDPGVMDRLLGALLGALNGALIGGYLLRYALESWDGGPAAAAIAASPAASLLVAWLPWYVLGMVGGTGVLVLVRLARDLAVSSAARRAASTASVASAPNLSEADRRLSSKIDDALKK